MVEGKTILVTGGAGFIGSALIGRLIEQNQIVAYDDLSRNSLRDRPYANHPNLRSVVGDVLDRERLRGAVAGADLIIHCAGITGIQTVQKSPIATLQVNAIGTAALLEEAALAGRCSRVLCFSTSEIFGPRALGSRETDEAVIGAAGEPRWTYAVSKLMAEHLALAFFRERRLPTTVLRPFNVYGPGQVGEGALRNFVLRALRDEPLEIHGEGTQIRAWCYVDDALDCMVRALTEPRAAGESFNLGNARAVCTVRGLAEAVVRVTGSRSQLVHVQRPGADIELRIPSVQKARELLGFEAQVGLDEGIRRTAAFYRERLR